MVTNETNPSPQTKQIQKARNQVGGFHGDVTRLEPKHHSSLEFTNVHVGIQMIIFDIDDTLLMRVCIQICSFSKWNNIYVIYLFYILYTDDVHVI